MIDNAEHGAQIIEAIPEHRATYLIATGGAALPVRRAVNAPRPLAFEGRGIKAIQEMGVDNIPLIVGGVPMVPRSAVLARRRGGLRSYCPT